MWRDGALRTAKSLPGEARHDVALAPLVAELLETQGLKPAQITGVAAVTGPGRFTSLRVGIAFARAFVLPHGTPLVGVSTGQLIQQASSQKQPGWLVMVKRGEVFAQTPALADPINLTFDQVPGWLAATPIDSLTVIGAGVPTEWDQLLPSGTTYHIWSALPLEVMGQVAERLLQGDIRPNAPVRPFYGTSTGAWDIAPAK